MAGTEHAGTRTTDGPAASGGPRTIAELLADHRPHTDREAADLARIAPLAAADDPYARERPLHVTASALIVHPAGREVLLRWHERQQDWLQVGGHGDPGEEFPGAVALREAREETGLRDLEFWPSAALLHVVVLPVPANDREPAHEHADLRFVLATGTPAAARPERPGARVRWLPLAEASTAARGEALRESLARVSALLADGAPAPTAP
ncbi:8-oxo-dGTP pyrophosphatase MutT (NUDIX family) [Streptomyces sp. TLI_235]|nr:NUDIX domain-containing protein [Streptomyces sp. TLI_235]PBC76058.1 8-oxo-dGTP pyrophosphatase MutT (NUDIX family) [Streptomyces sp. TLI_235]